MVEVFKNDPMTKSARGTKWGAAGDAICWGAVFALFCGVALGEKSSKTTLKVLRQIPHTGYSEGLDFHDGFLWRALPKTLAKISPKDGSVIAQYTPATEYSESLVWLAGVLWNVSFSNNGLYRGELKGSQFEFKRVADVPEVHAWGLVHDGKNLIVTGDYSQKLYFLDAKTGKLVRTLETDRKDLEDLAWDGVGIWASSFTQHRGQIFRIDPKTGKSGPSYTLPDAESCPVIDGLAIEGKTLWITGKQCPALYQVELPK